MKIRLLLILFMSMSIHGFSQTYYFSSNHVEACEWNRYSKEWTNCEGTFSSTVWSINSNHTTIKHRTETMFSTYWITGYDTEIPEGDKKNGYYVQSDAGNRYYIVFDFEYECTKVMPIYRDRETDWLLIYGWKNAWKE